MTTVALDGISVASDSQRVCGSERVDLATKKIKKVDGHLFAFTGDYGIFEPAIDWYLNKDADPEKAPKVSKDGNWRLLVIRSDGIMSYTDTVPYGEPFPYPQAFGSGASYALTAMRLGKTAEEAVKIAAEFDVWTAGPVQVVNIAEALGQLREAAE